MNSHHSQFSYAGQTTGLGINDARSSAAEACVERARQIPRALDTLDRLIATQEQAIAALTERLQPFMESRTAEQGIGDLPKGSTPIVNVIDGFSARIDRQNNCLLDLLSRLEV